MLGIIPHKLIPDKITLSHPRTGHLAQPVQLHALTFKTGLWNYY